MKTLREAIEVVLSAVAASKAPDVSEAQFLRELIVFANSGSLGNAMVSIPEVGKDVGRIEEASTSDSPPRTERGSTSQLTAC
jgi:hypothetical protein